MPRSPDRLGRRGLIGVLDIGTAKTCAAIASLDESGEQVLLGLGHQRSHGLKSGTVVDADAAERTVRAAVGQAERMSGASFDEVAISLSSGRLRSTSFVARAPVEGDIVRDADIGRILAGGEAWLERSGRATIQLTRSDWQLDGVADIADPRNLAGRELAVHLTAVTADDGPVRNVMSIVEKSHMLVERVVAAPYASALTVSTEEERRQGVLVVDMGAGVTSLAAFSEGRLVHVDAVPVGGNHVTYDIARELVATLAEAERIKTLYGTLVSAGSDNAEMITYPVAGGEEAGELHETSKAHVRQVVTPRIDGLFELLAERMAEAGIDAAFTRRTILTGGASQLLGLEQAWTRRFGGHVRVGRPQPIGRMSRSMCSPAFATVIGLLAIVSQPHADVHGGPRLGRLDGGYFNRLERWIRESF